MNENEKASKEFQNGQFDVYKNLLSYFEIDFGEFTQHVEKSQQIRATKCLGEEDDEDDYPKEVTSQILLTKIQNVVGDRIKYAIHAEKRAKAFCFLTANAEYVGRNELNLYYKPKNIKIEKLINDLKEYGVEVEKMKEGIIDVNYEKFFNGIVPIRLDNLDKMLQQKLADEKNIERLTKENQSLKAKLQEKEEEQKKTEECVVDLLTKETKYEDLRGDNEMIFKYTGDNLEAFIEELRKESIFVTTGGFLNKTEIKINAAHFKTFSQSSLDRLTGNKLYKEEEKKMNPQIIDEKSQSK